MKVAIASDHGGVRLKEFVKQSLQGRADVDVVDLGTNGIDSVDYPDFAAKVAEGLTSRRFERGILICGSGIGMSISANKFPGVRAAVAVNEYMARMSRAHNDANVLCLGERVVGTELASGVVDAFLGTPFEGGRHTRRVEKIAALEKKT